MAVMKDAVVPATTVASTFVVVCWEGGESDGERVRLDREGGKGGGGRTESEIVTSTQSLAPVAWQHNFVSPVEKKYGLKRPLLSDPPAAQDVPSPRGVIDWLHSLDGEHVEAHLQEMSPAALVPLVTIGLPAEKWTMSTKLQLDPVGVSLQPESSSYVMVRISVAEVVDATLVDTDPRHSAAKKTRWAFIVAAQLQSCLRS
jgi:hypothetical protein